MHRLHACTAELKASQLTWLKMELMNTNTAVATKSRTLDLNTSSSSVPAAVFRLLGPFMVGSCTVAAMLM
jgi:hypothetical protein